MTATVVPDRVFKALADPTRREILTILRDGASTVGEIAGNFHMSRPAVSKHLRQLRAAGLIVNRSVGNTSLCELNAEPLHVVDDFIAHYRSFWRGSLSRLKSHVEKDARARS